MVYRNWFNVVAREAGRNSIFYKEVLRVLPTPSDGWCNLIYGQLQNRLDIVIHRTHPNMVGDTANRLGELIHAIREMTGYWAVMQLATRLNYFGLLLKVLQHIVKSDVIVSTPGSGSGGSSPFTGTPAMNHNLYEIMVSDSQCSTAANLLNSLFAQMNGPLDGRQVATLQRMLHEVNGKYKKRRTPSPGRSPSPRERFLMALEELCNGQSAYN